jgi:NAD(P)H-quinone oxidoreductase subunit 4
MSGFASEVLVFIGITTSDIYSSNFRVVLVALAGVGLVLTPIYLLSMLRQLFYATGEAPACMLGNAGSQNSDDQEAVCFGTSCVLPSEATFSDARPREMFIAASFLVLIVGIGLYPKLVTKVYDATTVALNTQMRDSYAQVAKANPDLYAKGFMAPRIAKPEVASVSGMLK